MVFPRCAKCGVVACACALATVHSQSMCGQFDSTLAYCDKLVAEQPHGPHHDRPVPGAPTWVTAAAVSTASVSTILGAGIIPDHPTLRWVIKPKDPSA